MDLNTSYIGLREDLIEHIKGSNLNVLDVGCATGTNGSYLLDRQIATCVVGVEFDEFMSKKALEKYDKVFTGDLNSSLFVQSVISQDTKFDYIIFGDILEHLISPLDVLKSLKELLKDTGSVIISVPNIAHIELFIQVFIKGTWPKNKRGIFDKTHLRWFTKKDIKQLVVDSDLKVDLYVPKLRSRDAVGSKFGFWTKTIRLINKEWVTFQHIIVCSHG